MEKSKEPSLPFSSLVTHELSGSVRGLRISLERLETKHSAGLNEDSLKLLNDAVRSTRKIQHILDRLSGIAESELSPQDADDFDSLECVESVLSELDAEIRALGASVIVDVLPHIRYQREQFETVIFNLIGNALAHGGSANLVIEIASKSADGNCIFLVRDNGVGISAERQLNIFEPFMRGSKDTADGRLGLGLFICKRLVEANRGKIFVNSEEGVGTEFSFTIPLKKDD
jgi:signal transduction histidine kinase